MEERLPLSRLLDRPLMRSTYAVAGYAMSPHRSLSHALSDRKVRLLAALYAILPRHAVLSHDAETTHDECDGFTVFGVDPRGPTRSRSPNSLSFCGRASSRTSSRLRRTSSCRPTSVASCSCRKAPNAGAPLDPGAGRRDLVSLQASAEGAVRRLPITRPLCSLVIQ